MLLRMVCVLDTVTHQSVKKDGAVDGEVENGVNTPHHSGRMDITTLSLTIAALFTVPVVVAVVVALCIRQCKPSMYFVLGEGIAPFKASFGCQIH
jgi:hypothetical protein